MKPIMQFILQNKITLLGMLAGLIIAYFYWLNYGIYWGTYPLSSECWINCVYGILVGGFLSSLLTRQII